MYPFEAPARQEKPEIGLCMASGDLRLGGIGFGAGAAGTVGQLRLADGGDVEGGLTGVPPSGPGATLTPEVTPQLPPSAPPA